MDRYFISLTNFAELDIKDIVLYIGNILHNALAAEKWLDMVDEALEGLATLPSRNPIIPVLRLRVGDMRKAAAGNYLIFYTIDEKEERVIVVRILHATQNWLEILQAE